jgi:hypothetical protein
MVIREYSLAIQAFCVCIVVDYLAPVDLLLGITEIKFPFIRF